MNARIFCKTGQLNGAEYTIDKEATIGKSSKNNIVLYPAVISGKHARIYYDEKSQNFYLEDLGSRNGTSLDGTKVTKPEKLGDLQIITFAKSFDFIFQLYEKTQLKRENLFTDVDASGSPSLQQDIPALENLPGGKTIVATPAFGKQAGQEESVTSDVPKKHDFKTVISKDGAFVPATLPEPIQGTSSKRTVKLEQASSAVKFVLEVKIKKGRTERFQLSDGENTIGRSRECAIYIQDESLSRVHAMLMVRDSKVTVKDLDSKNHTSVNKKRVREETEIPPNAILRFGIVEARIVKLE